MNKTCYTFEATLCLHSEHQTKTDLILNYNTYKNTIVLHTHIKRRPFADLETIFVWYAVCSSGSSSNSEHSYFLFISFGLLLVSVWSVGWVWLVRKVLSPVSENVTFGVVDRILQFQSGIKRSFINMLFYFDFVIHYWWEGSGISVKIWQTEHLSGFSVISVLVVGTTGTQPLSWD